MYIFLLNLFQTLAKINREMMLRQPVLDAAGSMAMAKHQRDELTNAIAKWLVGSCRPLSIVEDAGLRNVLRIATNDDTYQPPSRRTITRRTQELFEKERSRKATALQRASTVALTGDYWTSLGNHNYLGVTVHYIDDRWELHSHALSAMRTQARHFAATCAGHFIHVAQHWNILDKITTLTTDSARHMIAAARQMPFEHVPCVSHSLHRSVTVSLRKSLLDKPLAKCRKVVGHFKHSPASAAELERRQIEHGQNKESLKQDIPTRWNSTLEMIKSVRRNEQPLRDVLASHITQIAMPTTAEMDKLQRLEKLLEPCKYATEILGGEKYVSCSAVLPAFSRLSRVMESSDDDPAYIVKFKSTFRTDLETRKAKANIAYLKIATALDPRFKNLTCIPRGERPDVWASVINLLVEQSEVTSQPEEEDSVENSLRRYRMEATISEDACPLEWWSKNADSHSRLASIARKYLTTPATSVPCERLFSLAGHIVQKRRVSLSAENVNNLVCLGNWLVADE